MDLLFWFGSMLLFLIIGSVAGGMAERSHFQRLKMRGEQMAHVKATDLRSFINPSTSGAVPVLVVAEVVIATDYMKSFLATLRNVVGGEVKSYQTLLVRARAEVLMSLKEQAVSLGLDSLANVRLETADIGGSASGRKGVVTVGIIGSATAYASESG